MNTLLRFSPLLVFTSILLLAIGLTMNHDAENITKAEISYLSSLHKIDSLQNVIDSLETEITILEDGFDSKESRYEDIISEYENGISYIKEWHPKAYKDFHRIIGFKEKYSYKLEKENNERLNSKEL